MMQLTGTLTVHYWNQALWEEILHEIETGNRERVEFIKRMTGLEVEIVRPKEWE